jgi:hypothetical protein
LDSIQVYTEQNESIIHTVWAFGVKATQINVWVVAVSGIYIRLPKRRELWKETALKKKPADVSPWVSYETKVLLCRVKISWIIGELWTPQKSGARARIGGGRILNGVG